MTEPTHPLRIGNFRAYMLARLSMMLAHNSMVVVLGWQVYDVARRSMGVKEAAFQLGLIGLFQFVPLMLVTPFSGWVADRLDRRLVASGALMIEVISASTLALTTWTGTVTLPLLFIIAALFGIARAFASPALGALAPRLVPPALLPTAIALSSIAWQAGAIVGPAMGGGLYAINAALPYAVATGLLTIALISLATIRGIIHPPMDASQTHIFRQMIDGIHYVRRNRIVLGALSLDLWAVLLGGATAMLPIYARDILHVGSEGLGLLRGAPAVGALLVGLIFSVRPLKHNVGIKLLGSVVIFGLATIAFGFSRSMPISLVCLVILGAADMVSVYVRQSLIQLNTPDNMRGRVGAVSILFISGSNELGEAESGFLAGLIGPVAAVVAGGIGAVMIALIWAKRFPELRLARSFDPVEQEKVL